MKEQVETVDQLYLNAERLAEDFSLFPRKETSSFIEGVLTDRQIELKLDQLRKLDVDAYIAATVAPCEEARDSARDIISSLDVPIIHETIDGPFYSAECEFDFNGTQRTIGFIAQERSYALVFGGQSTMRLRPKLPVICGALNSNRCTYGYARSGW